MKDKNLNQLRKSIKNKLSRNTQSDFAKELGISQSYLSMLLSGQRNPKNGIDILKKINTKLSLTFSKN